MTNAEKITKELSNGKCDFLCDLILDKGTIIDYICEKICSDGCDGGCDGDCKNCLKKWLETKVKNEIPKLETGMFVEMGYDWENCGHFGIVVGNDVIYQNGGHDDMAQFNDWKDNVVAIYKADRFSRCNENYLIWKREDD